MAKTLSISFVTSGSDAADLMHRVRNFAEDLERALRANNLGVVLNPDTAVDVVSVRVESTRRMGDTLAAVRRELKRHHLEQEASYERHA